MTDMIMRIFQKVLHTFIFRIYYCYKLGRFGIGSRIYSPLKIDGAKRILISKNVLVQYKTWLAAVPLTGVNDCRLEIGEGSIIGNFNHIYCTGLIKIGCNVLTADKVYISDNMHNYQDISIPISKQTILQRSEVIIGDGSWLGENVCVIGAKIGRGCVIGANSVVTHDIPDYSVAVGSPAKVIKKYNHLSMQWEKYSGH